MCDIGDTRLHRVGVHNVALVALKLQVCDAGQVTGCADQAARREPSAAQGGHHMAADEPRAPSHCNAAHVGNRCAKGGAEARSRSR